MGSASQSIDSGGARQLLDDVEVWTRRGWRLASPAWFSLLCTALAVLASVPAGLLLDGGLGVYWWIAAPATTVASGWYFSTRPAQPPESVGVVVAVTGLAVLVGALALGGVVGGSWGAVMPWLVVGIGFGIFAVEWRSITTAGFSLVCIATAVSVAIIEPSQGYEILALAIGVAAGLAALTDLVRSDVRTP